MAEAKQAVVSLKQISADLAEKHELPKKQMTEVVDALVSHGRRRLANEVGTERGRVCRRPRRHVHEVLRLRDRRRVAVVRPVTDLENHGRGSIRVRTLCGDSSVRLK